MHVPPNMGKRFCFLLVTLGIGGIAVSMNRSANRPGNHENVMGQGQPAAASRNSSETPVRLPATVGHWKLKDGTRTITAKTIFDYMDGAGELYIGYRFRQLEVHEYTATGADDILAELYWMASSDDAFGLLSGDWGGEAVSLKAGGAAAGASKAGSWPRALYGAGLLRLWADNLYARVLAQSETDASRKAVLEIGRAIIAGRREPAPPKLAAAMPARVQPTFSLQQDRLCYFRSHLVLNSVYFLSPSNILDLGTGVEAVVASYRTQGQGKQKSAVRLLVIRYPGVDAGRKALSHFIRTYLPEKKAAVPTGSGGSRGILKIEDGWVGYSLTGFLLALAFECPTREIADNFLNQATMIAVGTEESHER
ncbi:MAG: hypothetical protein H6Q05_2959 [Acidobacteria bacterium]|nr:hypothetical protein [Acidobacteriota bacterium]